MALERCTKGERIRDREDSIIKHMPEEYLELLFACNPEVAEYMEDSLAVSCASKEVLTAWLQAGKRSGEQKLAVVRTVLQTCTDASANSSACGSINIHRADDHVNMTWKAIPAFLRELYHSVVDTYDRNLVCRLAYGYWLHLHFHAKHMEHGVVWDIPDEDMREFFSEVRLTIKSQA